jgi:hypothetical protein
MPKPKNSNLNIDRLQELFEERIWIAITQEDIENAERQIGKYSSNLSRKTALINYLCQSKLIPTIREYSDLDAKLIYPNSDTQESFWDIINGFKLTVGNKHEVVLIPGEYYDLEAFEVPQEWVDIPKLSGEYYLAVQVKIEEGWMSIWGYATHKEIKEHGEYSSISRCYSLDSVRITTDVNLIWTAIELGIKEVVDLDPIPALSPVLATKLIEQLSKPSLFDIRHYLEFKQWAGIIKDDSLRNQLYQSRIAPPIPVIVSQSFYKVVGILSDVIISGTALAGWIISPIPAIGSQPSFRSTYRSSSKQAQEIIELLHSKTPTGELQQAFISLDGINIDNLKIRESLIKALVNLIDELDREEPIRWLAADKLYEIDPKHPSAGVQQQKGISFDERTLDFKIGIIALPNNKFAIRAFVRPNGKSNQLPQGLEMVMFDLDNRELIRKPSKIHFKADRGDEFVISLKSPYDEIRMPFKI